MPHLTAQHIRQYSLCPCALYLNDYGPEEEKAPPHAFVEHLTDLGREYEQQVASELPHVAVPDGPIAERANITLRFMAQGVDRIYQPVLLSDNLLGIPDFIERTNTPSDLGPFSYRPVDVKIATRAKPEHVAQLAFYGLLLGHAQGLIPQTADIILVDGNRETIELAEHMETVEQAIEHIQAIQQGERQLPTLSSECAMCPWHDYCLRMLYALKDISLLNGLSGTKKGALIGAGYADLPDISNADPEDLNEIKGIGESTAQRMVMQAEVLIDGQPRMLTVPRFPEAEVELYLDMECQQQTQVIYLIGVLECREGSEEKFRPFLAGSPGHEGKMWAEFLAYLESLPDAVAIYHYHHFESTHLTKLVERHGIDEHLEDKLFGNLIDLHRVLKESVVLPLHSYGLKPVAKWMGFEWRETKADAAMSMLWFDLWLMTGDRRYLELSVEYNEDDCRATKVVREWIEEIVEGD